MGGEKTEQPSAKRLRDAREKGQVAKSTEVPSTCVVIAVFALVSMTWGSMTEQLKQLMLRPPALFNLPFEQALGIMLPAAVEKFVFLSFPIVLLAAGAGVVGHLAQAGFLFTVEPLTPSLEKLNPAQWFKKVFSIKNLVEFLKSCLKIAVITYVLWKVFLNAIPTLVLMPYGTVDNGVACLGAMTYEMVKYCGGAFVVIAACDYFWQRHSFMKQNMMSKEEVMNEYKEMEGDPHIKSQRKHLHQEMVMGDSTAQVRKSTVLVTNPTHIAVALRYQKGETPLPVVTARGEGALARRMIEVAEEEGIPIMRNVPLAHDLWDHATVNQYIPSEMIEPVAEVLRWVQEVTARR